MISLQQVAENLIKVASASAGGMVIPFANWQEFVNMVHPPSMTETPTPPVEEPPPEEPPQTPEDEEEDEKKSAHKKRHHSR